MTDLRTELGGIISNFQVSVEGMEYSDKGRVNYYNKQLEEALTAILKLIEERYVEREKSDILAREYVDNYWRERSCDFISHQEAYEIAKNAVDIDEDDNLRTAFHIPEGKE